MRIRAVRSASASEHLVYLIVQRGANAVEEADGKLTADFNTFRVGLRHHHYDTFATEGPIGELPAGLTLTFAANPKGEISTLSVTLGSEKGLQPIVFTK